MNRRGDPEDSDIQEKNKLAFKLSVYEKMDFNIVGCFYLYSRFCRPEKEKFGD